MHKKEVRTYKHKTNGCIHFTGAYQEKGQEAQSAAVKFIQQFGQQ